MTKRKEQKLTGIAASPGISFGSVYLYDEDKYIIPNYKIDVTQIESEVKRFYDALKKTKSELMKLQQKFLKNVKDKQIDFFKMHILALEDPYIEKEVINEIVTNLKNAEAALYEVMNRYIQNLQSLQNEYLSSRTADIYDLAKKIMRNLLKKRHTGLSNIEEPAVIVAKDLTPTDTAGMDKTKIIGFVTDLGGPTSHTAIVARALEIPAVVGLQDITKRISEGDFIIVDGNNGVVIINPSEKTLTEYKTAQRVFIKFSEELKKIKHLQPVTIDKKYIKITSNIEIREEIDSSIIHGSEGIGLFRTEFLYLNRANIPTEKELYDIFREAVEKMKPYEVIFRTLDIGGDKIGGGIKVQTEPDPNPFLGYRAIRYCLENIDILKTQIRAILRASYYGDGKIMFPMVSSVDEIRQLKEVVEDTKKELEKEKKHFKKDIKIGIMVEIPSIAIISDMVAREVDFFSIGTNDLVQYTLAVDRTNPKVSHLYEPFHPAVIRVIKSTVDNAHKNNIEVHICGELAADPMGALLFIGMGVDMLSMSAIAIPEIKKLIRSVKFSDAQQIVKEILKFDTAQKVKQVLYDFIKKNLPDISSFKV